MYYYYYIIDELSKSKTAVYIYIYIYIYTHIHTYIYISSCKNMDIMLYEFYYSIDLIFEAPILNTVMSYNQFCVIDEKIMTKSPKSNKYHQYLINFKL